MEDIQVEVKVSSRDVCRLIQNNELGPLQTLLTHSPACAHGAPYSRSPLATAIKHDNLQAAQVLLDAGASPLERARETFGTPRLGTAFLTALEMASALGRARLVRLLLVRLKGMSPTGVVIEGCNETDLLQGAMIQGATYGQPTVVAEFLNVFTCSDETPIHVLWAAADRWEIDVVDLILRRFRFQQPVLAEALNRAMEGKTRRTDEYGTDIAYHDNDADKHYRVVTRLIDVGNLGTHVAKNAPRLLQQAIFEMARKGGLRALLDKGVNPNLRLENGCTALHVLAAPINFSDWNQRIRR